MFKFIKSRLAPLSRTSLDVNITLLFVILFITFTAWPETRTTACINLLWGGFTTNVPGMIVVFYIAVMVFLGKHEIHWKKGELNYKTKHIRDIEEQNITGEADMDVSVNDQ